MEKDACRLVAWQVFFCFFARWRGSVLAHFFFDFRIFDIKKQIFPFKFLLFVKIIWYNTK